jgi:hypothetical protein
MNWYKNINLYNVIFSWMVKGSKEDNIDQSALTYDIKTILQNDYYENTIDNIENIITNVQIKLNTDRLTTGQEIVINTLRSFIDEIKVRGYLIPANNPNNPTERSLDAEEPES